MRFPAGVEQLFDLTNLLKTVVMGVFQGDFFEIHITG